MKTNSNSAARSALLSPQRGERIKVRGALLAVLLLLSSVFCLLYSTAAPAAVRYPITVISGTTTGYVDTIILPPGMIVSNLPGGGVMLYATNLTTGASTIPPFSISASYATNAGTATFASNAGSLNGLPGTSYLTTAATNGMTTNFVGLTFYVSKLGSDSNPGTQMSPFLTLSNAVAKLSSNIYQTTTYTFAFSLAGNLTNNTFTFGTSFASRVTLTWATNNPPGANQILATSGSGGAGRATNALQLLIAITNNIPLPNGGSISRSGQTVTLISATGTVFSVGSDMTNYCVVSSNANFSVTNYGPADIRIADNKLGTVYIEPQLLIPPNVSLHGDSEFSTIISNTSATTGIQLTESNLVENLTIICPLCEPFDFGDSEYSTVRWVTTHALTDGFTDGGPGNVADHCSIWSKWDSCFSDGIIASHCDFHSLGPWPGANEIGTAVRAGGTFSECTFEVSGFATNRAISIESPGYEVRLNECTISTTNTGTGQTLAIYNNGGSLTLRGTDYDHSAVSGAVAFAVGPYTINVNGTASGSTNTAIFPAGKVILNATLSVTNIAGCLAVGIPTGSNAVNFAVTTNGLPCTSCPILGIATGYDQ